MPHPVGQLVMVRDSLLKLFVEDGILEVVPDLPLLARAPRELVPVLPEVLDYRCLAWVGSVSAWRG